MKKRILSILSMLMIGIALTACGSGEPVSVPSVAENDKAAVQDKLNKTNSKSETQAEKKDETISVTEMTSTDLSVPETESNGTNILVAYFSRADENYNVGTIDVGNTQIIAEYIANEVGADSFHIETVTPYPADYDDCCDVAKQELADKARPEIQGSVGYYELLVDPATNCVWHFVYKSY